MTAQNKIPQWIALLGVALSCAWLISHPGYEPAIALASSSLAWLGLKYKRDSRTIAPPSAGLPYRTKSQLHLSALLKGAYISDRPRVIKESLNAFPSITPLDVAEILELLYIADRPEALSLLSSKISPPPSSSEATKILNQLYIADRPSAAKLISKVHSAALGEANDAVEITDKQ